MMDGPALHDRVANLGVDADFDHERMVGVMTDGGRHDGWWYGDARGRSEDR